MKIERPKSLKELVVEQLRARIIDGRFRLGAALSENVLAAELGMSKTPVREALQQLRSEGLVDVLPQRGTYVFRLAADQVELISELRTILEVASVAAAVERNFDTLVEAMENLMGAMQAAYDDGDTVLYHTLDGDYHDAFIELCGNPYVGDAYSQIRFRIRALRSRLSNEAALNSRSLKDHKRMLELVKARDVPGVQQLLASHIEQTKSSYLAVLADRDLLTEEMAS
ncbi:GntR family transcriptional regulator [Corticibacterium sp. UT-5YL-CI-8]|nr:GntR family transcriptional regulator [Tianweitania sp. UT-5YL-CI-8]